MKIKLKICCVYDYDRDRDREQKLEVDLIIVEFACDAHRERSWNLVVCMYSNVANTQYVKYTKYIYIN